MKDESYISLFEKQHDGIIINLTYSLIEYSNFMYTVLVKPSIPIIFVGDWSFVAMTRMKNRMIGKPQ